MAEPQVDVEVAKDTFTTYSDWPVPDTADVDVFLRGTTQAAAGALGLSSGGDTDTLTWLDAPGQSENTMINNPTGSQANRRVFLSPVLTHDLHISGTPVVDIQASLDKTQTNLGALLVDYGAGTQVSRTSDGIQNVNPDHAQLLGRVERCRQRVLHRRLQAEVNVTSWRVTKGILDSSNRDSLTTPTLADVGVKYRFTWPTHPAGLRVPGRPPDRDHPRRELLAVLASINGTTGTTVTLDTRVSKVHLPIVGGYRAAVASGGFAADTVAPELHGVPANIAVDTESGDGRTVTYTPPTATDNEDPAPVVECVPPSGANFGVGTTEVVCTATDASGNSTSASFTVTVRWVDDEDGDVDGEVPATLSLTVTGGAASLGAFTPGVARDYFGSLSANVISTAESATLSVADPDAVNTGHLVNGAFALPNALQVNGSSPLAGSSPFAPLGGSAAPTTLLTYGAPVSNDPVTLGFKQSIGADRRAADGDLQQDADLHAVHHGSVAGFHDPRQQRCEPGVEVPAALGGDLGERVVDRPRVLVGARRGQRVEHVADRADAADERDVLAGEAGRVAAAVPALVVGAGDDLAHLHERRARAGEQVGADRRVALHDLPLGVGERARLAEDRVGDRDLADVVHRARVAQDLGLFGIQAGCEREPVAQLAHPADVVAGLLVARLDGLAEPLDDLELGGAQLARTDADLLLEPAVELAGVLAADRLEQVADHDGRDGREQKAAERRHDGDDRAVLERDLRERDVGEADDGNRSAARIVRIRSASSGTISASAKIASRFSHSGAVRSGRPCMSVQIAFA